MENGVSSKRRNLLNSPLCGVWEKERRRKCVTFLLVNHHRTTATTTITFTFKVFSSSFLTFSSCLFPLLRENTQISDDDDDERGNVLAGYTKFPFMKALVSFSVLMIVKWQRCVQRVHLISCCFLLLLSYFTWCTGKYSTCFWKVFFERGKKRMILLIMRKVCVQKSSLFCYYYIPYHFIPACYKVA